jgi:hypothetical protein
MDRVILTNASQPYNLLDLIKTIDTAFPDLCEAFQIQFDPDAGMARLYIGNSNVSATRWGTLLQAGQAHGWQSMGVDTIPLKRIFLLCDTAAKVVGLTVYVR